MLTRRDVLQKCLTLGSAVIASHVSPEVLLAAFQDREKQIRKPTPVNTLGPFYKRLAPVNARRRLRPSHGASGSYLLTLPFVCGLVPPGDSEKNVLVPRFFLLFSLLDVP